ncbi:S1 family peptidase [Agrococcus sp. Marseille-Q4369]|uniref:S1 family peptidase n=1 Tax=Agrococcus sp. Marseille-Q4369 TaxID=2810513 RepID=UPI001B8BE08C|nr:S1 family peptidase [Agrococcus sp. Marseille-Q4369]QUW18643.1 hypothetical protein JSQ78_12770 [Agrococcus sp. Marseille-Q4369]
MRRSPLLFIALAAVCASATLVVPVPSERAIAETLLPDDPALTASAISPAGPANQPSRYAGVTTTELEDLSVLASSLSIGLEEAVQRFAGVTQFNTAVNSLPATAVVHAEWQQGSGSLHVRPGQAGAARDALEAAGADASVSAVDLPNVVEQEELQQAVIERLQRDAFVPVSTHFDVLASTPTIYAQLPLSERGSSWNARGVQSDAADAASELGVAVEVTYAEEPVGELAASGGMPHADCTGGLIMRSTSVTGTYGIMTAHHCTTVPSSYDGAAIGGTSISTNRDIRINRFTSGTAVNQIRNNWGTYRTITYSGNPANGSPVCKFGVKTGQSCSTVASSGNCSSFFPGYTFCALHRTATRYVEKGDSGGPWYYGNTGWGITSGTNKLAGYDFFTGAGAANFNYLSYAVKWN